MLADTSNVPQSIAEELNAMRARIATLSPAEQPAFLARAWILTELACQTDRVITLRKHLKSRISTARLMGFIFEESVPPITPKLPR